MQLLEINDLVQDLFQRIVLHRVHLPRRKVFGRDAEQAVAGRKIHIPRAHHLIKPAGLQGRELACLRDLVPELHQQMLGEVPPAFFKPVDGAHAVHSACAGAADPVYLDPLVVEQPVYHAPGVGPVGAAALEGQVNFFRFHSDLN